MARLGHLLIVALHWAICWVSVIWAAVVPVDYNNETIAITSRGHDLSKRQNAKPELRILSLGASIVYGIRGANDNSFRKLLRDQLRLDQYTVNMVGSRNNGDMVDNDVEANPGDLVSDIHRASHNSYGYKPNVVVINAGTNDCTGGVDINGVGGRMESLLTELWAQDGMQDTFVALSSILPSGVAACVSRRNAMNEQYKALVTKLLEQGRPILFADMDGSVTTSMLVDGTHPNDTGYWNMARIFWGAITRAQILGYLKPPAPLEITGGTTCEKRFGSGIYAGGLTQRGSGTGDGIYYHDSQSKGIVLTITSDWDRNQWFFARLYGRNRDDLVGWFEKSPGVHAYGVWRNTGNDADPTKLFTKIADLPSPSFCIPRGVHWVDLNADGYDDFVCISPDGTMYAAINKKDGTATTPPTFNYLDVIKTPEGYAQDRVRIGDIDGDGRADYCVLDDGGNIWCWRNGWVDDKPAYWQAMGKRFLAKGKGDIRGVRFEDINGDGRDDWIWVSDIGEVETWTNSRSCASGKLGDGLNVAWRQGFHKGQSSGYTHLGMGEYGSSGLRDRVHFARIFDEPQAFGLLGRQDYVFMKHTDISADKHQFDVMVWKNIGSGATKLEADGNKYCNMKGYSDGRMDYVWTWSTGKMELYPNKGLKFVVGEESFWGPVETMFDPANHEIKQMDRRDLHLVDWDGDGACDIVWVDPNNNNRVTLWLNRYKSTQNWGSAWQYNANPAPQLSCLQKRGLDLHDLAVRFADVSGNNRGDYLCIEPDGRVSGYVHNSDNSWTYIDQFKFAEGKDRANLRWADVNGDGRDDMLWVDKWNGDGYVYYNNGPKNVGGSRYEWIRIDTPVYDGNHAGTCMYYPDLDGDGRADMHSIMGTWTNQAETWWNRCSLTDEVGDDPGGPVDPNFPPIPGLPGTTNPGDPDTCNIPPFSTCGDVDSDASCQDLKGAPLSREMWVAADTDDMFRNWYRDDFTGDEWLPEFAQPLGWQQSYETCTVFAPCDRKNCNEMEDESLAGTGWQYMVTIAASNLSNFLSNIYTALSDAGAKFGGTEAILTNTFYPSPTAQDVKAAKFVANAIQAALTYAIATAVLLVPPFKILAPLVPLIIFSSQMFKDALPGGLGEGIELPALAEIETIATKFIDAMKTGIERTNNFLLVDEGKSDNPDLADITAVFEEGYWVDADDLPAVSPGTGATMTELTDMFYQALAATVVNWAWIKRGHFLYCFEMTQEKFDTEVAKGGSNDRRLKMWFPPAGGNTRGTGCYFQSARLGRSDFNGTPEPRHINPEGWGKLDSEAFKFTTWDVMKSSWNGYQIGGLGYTTTDPGEITKPELAFDDLKAMYGRPGFFNIPICMPTIESLKAQPGDYEYALSLFFGNMNEPTGQAGFPSFCFCYRLPDKNGKTLMDIGPADEIQWIVNEGWCDR